MRQQTIVWGLCMMVATAAWPGEAGKPLLVGDKTLVAWACVANLSQRGGSALTIEDGRPTIIYHGCGVGNCIPTNPW